MEIRKARLALVILVWFIGMISIGISDPSNSPGAVKLMLSLVWGFFCGYYGRTFHDMDL